jgi:HPt (histidine-containing phosphotransfer) domain-containing protein
VTIQHPCTALFESIGCDEEAYGELLDVFLEDAEPRVTAIRSAVESCDVATLAREAHTDKRLASESAALFDVIRRDRSALLHAA